MPNKNSRSKTNNGASLEVLPPEFYARPTLEVAPDLLGTLLWRRYHDGTIISAPIVEVEAYTADDPACHASRGKTARCAVMFGPPGYAYVYFIYGMYFCLNVVTEPEETAGAVLIRALGAPGSEGPGKLCRLWSITREHNGANLMDPNGDIWITTRPGNDLFEIGVSNRVGISVAQEQPWRFFIKDNPFVSVRNVKPHKGRKRK